MDNSGKVQLAGSLGNLLPFGGPIASGVAGVAYNPDRPVASGLGSAAGSVGGSLAGGIGGGIAGGLGGALLGGAGGGLASLLMDNDLFESDLEQALTLAGGGALLGGYAGAGLGALGGGMYGSGRGARAIFDEIEKNSSVQETSMYREKLAYAHGAATKLAERNIDPATFIAAAVYTGDRGALKVASLILDGVGIEKYGSAGARVGDEALEMLRNAARKGELDVGGEPSMKALRDKVVETFGGAAQSAPPMGPARPPSVDLDPDIAKQLDASAANRAGYEAAPEAAEEGMSPALMAALGLGGAGTVGTAAGVGAGLSAPDTMGNKLRSALGMDTKNRFQYAMGG